MRKRRQSSRMLAPSAVAKVTNSKRRDMVDASFHGMAGLLWEASVPARCVNHVPEPRSAISPGHTPSPGGRGDRMRQDRHRAGCDGELSYALSKTGTLEIPRGRVAAITLFV